MGRAVRAESLLAPAIGIAAGKFPARTAARLVVPNHARYVAPGGEAALLAPLPVEVLPLEAEMARRLRLLGIRTVGQFAALPTGAVLTQFGREGQRLHRLAHGRDEAVLQPRLSRPSAEAIYHFEDPVGDRAILEAALGALAAQVVAQLSQLRMAGQTLLLRLVLEDRSRQERRRHLPWPIQKVVDVEWFLKGLLKQVGVRCGVVTAHALVTNLVPLAASGQQLSLFDGARRPHLDEALPKIVARYDDTPLFRVFPDDPASPLVERHFEFRPVRVA
jgi:nucleotidyltransferase/DNA polymerase involved in DNA repair